MSRKFEAMVFAGNHVSSAQIDTQSAQMPGLPSCTRCGTAAVRSSGEIACAVGRFHAKRLKSMAACLQRARHLKLQHIGFTSCGA
jgi:hypothetical protein